MGKYKKTILVLIIIIISCIRLFYPGGETFIYCLWPKHILTSHLFVPICQALRIITTGSL